ncbi:MAG: lipoate--protein ligase [Oscillospiraceae bacterium]|nr:lipoate--protein ligase [Oscillospiraceae bacterium]
MLTIINLETTDPAFNLAAEQYVFDCLPKDRSYFMLWQNDGAVIIGKYQNTLAEINEPFVRAHDIKVVRRLSGGGAVYHDLGNLNYTYITDAGESEALNMRAFCEPIVKALAQFGANAKINGRNDMTIEGKKFSGNAQYVRHGRVMHHGTILFDSDLSAVDHALRVDPEKIKAKGIESVRSRVTNIRPYLQEDITMPDFREMLLKEIGKSEKSEAYAFTPKDLEAIKQIKQERYDTWEWNYGRSPECTLFRGGRTEGCGTVEIYIRTDHGLITDIQFRGDFFSARDPEELAPRFIGKKPDEEGFHQALQDVEVDLYFSGMTKVRMEELLNGMD